MNKYIVIIRVANASNERIREVAPKIFDEIKNISNDDSQVAFTTPDGSTFGILLKTSLSAKMISTRLCGNASTDQRPSILMRDDSILVIQVSDDAAENGFKKAVNWLNHR